MSHTSFNPYINGRNIGKYIFLKPCLLYTNRSEILYWLRKRSKAWCENFAIRRYKALSFSKLCSYTLKHNKTMVYKSPVHGGYLATFSWTIFQKKGDNKEGEGAWSLLTNPFNVPPGHLCSQRSSSVPQECGLFGIPYLFLKRSSGIDILWCCL